MVDTSHFSQLSFSGWNTGCVILSSVQYLDQSIRMAFSQGYSCLIYSIIRVYCSELMNSRCDDRLSSPDTNS